MAMRCLDCFEAVLVEFHIPRSNGEVIQISSLIVPTSLSSTRD